MSAHFQKGRRRSLTSLHSPSQFSMKQITDSLCRPLRSIMTMLFIMSPIKKEWKTYARLTIPSLLYARYIMKECPLHQDGLIPDARGIDFFSFSVLTSSRRTLQARSPESPRRSVLPPRHTDHRAWPSSPERSSARTASASYTPRSPDRRR